MIEQLTFLNRLDIMQESSVRILALIRMCHPNEHGEPFGRWEVMAEIKRRSDWLLDDLGWVNATIWKNRYTGSEETLEQRWRHDNDYKRISYQQCYCGWFRDHLCHIVQDWSPKEIWEPSGLLNCYKDLFNRCVDI